MSSNASLPNIVVLYTDQQRADALSCSGNPHIRTPNLDRLASEGIRFAHAATTTPVCIASRYSLITGRRVRDHQFPAMSRLPGPRRELPTLMTLLGDAGYRTHGVGKFHFQPTGRHHGFHHMELMEETPVYRADDDYLLYLQTQGYGHIREAHGVRNLLYQQPQTTIVPEEHVGSTWVADRSIAFLRDHARHRAGRPFFLWSSWIAPHPPWNVPESFKDAYRPEDLPLPVYTDRPDEDLSPHCQRMRDLGDGAHRSPARLRAIKASYYAQVSLVDKNVGRVLGELDRLNLTDNTLVIFTSDHGEMLGDHGLWHKSCPYEASIRVPFLLRFPGRVSPGQVQDDLVSQLDILPTCLQVAGLGSPESLPGASLLGRRSGGLAEPRDEIVIDHGSPPQRWVCLRDQRYAYAIWLDSGERELYDLAEDPSERTNLVDRERDLARYYERRLVDWEREHGFADSLDGERFASFTTPVPSERPIRNAQFPPWVRHLPPDEQAELESPGETIMNAIRGQTTYRLDELDLQFWKERGGDLRGTPYEGLWHSIG